MASGLLFVDGQGPSGCTTAGSLVVVVVVVVPWWSAKAGVPAGAPAGVIIEKDRAF